MPELHVLHPSSNELIRHIWVNFNNKYLVLASPVKKKTENDFKDMSHDHSDKFS